MTMLASQPTMPPMINEMIQSISLPLVIDVRRNPRAAVPG
jgi:hypothetical protein